ncbi:MAG: type II secretion system F family protein [Solobacterium sp.]|jgi:type IV pilus assembly protein PilC|nr:type II secretion system F family protein [Solobacterium sp.]MCH4204859.1 type II secretion system F family protein [Solobacterium sp.]MCH4226483.1 type II secretion system F family protein [Solobacterium sp.]MCH4283047.1 type II secretion system F family protein [Solobacterium sp.]
MITYKYSALSPDGDKVNGVVNAIDEFAAVEKIRADCPIVLKIEPVKKGGIYDILGADIGGKKVDAKALSVMCSQFAVIIGSGISIEGCLNMVSAQTEDKKLKKMLSLSAEDVAQGTSLATAFEKNYPQLPPLFIETVRAGEMSGTLDQSFNNLYEYYKRSNLVAQKTKSAMAYPMFVLAVAAVVLVIIMVKVMPTFTSMFNDFGGELPTITVVLIAITNWFQKGWMLIAGIAAVLFIAFKLWTHNEKGKLQWSKLTLKMPTMGKINKLNASQQFSTSMASLIGSGLTVAQALKVTSKCIDNYAIAKEVSSMSEKIETGAALSDVIKSSEFFPDVLKEMTGVGERTGELVKTLQTVGAYYTQETEYATQKMIARLEPTMLVFIAIIAGFIVLAIYLPMFTMYNYM